jgi:predicted Zn-dependent protease
VRIGEISGAEIGLRAIDKCLSWRKPVRLDPGRYTVVLEPTAVSDLVRLLGTAFSARLAEEGRSFLAKKGGGTYLGEKVFPEHITMRTDPADRRFPSALWVGADGEFGRSRSSDGLPNRPVVWIEKGVVRNLSYDRYWASKSGKQPTPNFNSVILEGGSGTAEDLLKDVERGLLVTRFWYIRPVNMQTLQLTGLTRDGLFLIENGKITQPVVNFRFNDGPVNLLKNAQRLGTPRRTRGGEGGGMAAPPVVATNFNFTSISDAI